jgi:hypothetical protein
MRVKLEVQESERTGQAYTCVPGSAMWELVEYLALQRTQVHYGYTREGFTVTFLHLEKEAAQRMLDEWTGSWMRDNAFEETPAEGRPEAYCLAG